MDLRELKDTITKQGQPFIWFTPAGWFFHEQPESVMRTREEVLVSESIEDLLASSVEDNQPKPETEIQKPAYKRGKKK